MIWKYTMSAYVMLLKKIKTYSTLITMNNKNVEAT